MRKPSVDGEEIELLRPQRSGMRRPSSMKVSTSMAGPTTSSAFLRTFLVRWVNAACSTDVAAARALARMPSPPFDCELFELVFSARSKRAISSIEVSAIS